MPWHVAVPADSLDEDEITSVKIGGQDVAVCRTGGGYYAVHNVCTHQYALLSDGYVEDGCIECPLHQGKFDVKTGRPMAPPVTEPVRTFPTKVEGGQVLVEIE